MGVWRQWLANHTKHCRYEEGHAENTVTVYHTGAHSGHIKNEQRGQGCIRLNPGVHIVAGCNSNNVELWLLAITNEG